MLHVINRCISITEWSKSLMIKSLLFNSSLNMFISFLYISSIDLYVNVDLFQNSSFLIKTSTSLVILFEMIVFNLLNFAFSNILSPKNSDWSLSSLSMLASFAFLGVSIKFNCVDKLGVASKESSKDFQKYRESYWMENFVWKKSLTV